MSLPEPMTDRTRWDPELERIGRRLDQVDGELERAICEAVYRSPAQRWRRRGIGVLLGIKHALRGLLFSWPLYGVGLAAFTLPQAGGQWLTLFLLPGVWISVVILRRGVRDDYRRFVHRILLKPGAVRHILFSAD